MAWRFARGARGRDNPIPPPARSDKPGRASAVWPFLFSEPPGAQVAFQLAKVFGQFRGPLHALAGLVRMFEGEDLCMQGLAREINTRAGFIRPANSRVICAVADQRESGIGSLNTD